MHIAIRTAAFGLMTMFVSCGVGADFSAKDPAFVTPNADTPYSFVWMNLRTKPLVLTLPPIE
jgi:hypothetical protein